MNGGIKKYPIEKIDGVRGQVRNTILQDGEIVLTDNGLFDLSKSGKIRRLVLTAYNICIAGSIRLLERVNEKHQQTIDPARIKQIPYSGSKFEKWLGEFLLETVMLPLYERHENKSRTNTQALSNTLLIS